MILQDESQSPGADSTDDGEGSEERTHHIQPFKLKKSGSSVGVESSGVRSDGIVGANGYGGPSPAKRPRSKIFRVTQFHALKSWDYVSNLTRCAIKF